MKIIYCDHSATTKVKKEVLNEMIPYYMNQYGNASSLYSVGRDAKYAITQARRRVARAINASAQEIYFTSCGSESDNLALKGFCHANKQKGKHIITSKIEHPAILQTCLTLEKEGFEVIYLDVDKNGFVDINQLTNAIRKDTILVSIMTANNEIGTIEDIKAIGSICKNNNIIFHTDSVQAIGNVKIDVQEMNIDMLSMSAHKFYGPKGVGALYVREGIEFDRIQDGGHQERDKRSGTENVAGIAGLGKAIELASNNFDDYTKKLTTIRDYFIDKAIKEFGKENVRINGDLNKRLPGHVSISFRGKDSNLILLELDKKGICASGGSACCSSSATLSHVLQAIKLEREWAEGTIRLTFGDDNTKEDVDYIIESLKEIIK